MLVIIFRRKYHKREVVFLLLCWALPVAGDQPVVADHLLELAGEFCLLFGEDLGLQGLDALLVGETSLQLLELKFALLLAEPLSLEAALKGWGAATLEN